MPLIRVPIYPTRNLATEIDPGARTIYPGTNVTFTYNADGSITINATGGGGGGSGTVTSVGLAAPTGFTVSGSPVTVSGTLTFAYAPGYQGYTTAEATKLAGIEAGATVDVAPTSIQASENLAAGDFVNIHNSGGSRVRRADLSIAAGDGAAHGFVTTAVTSGNMAPVRFEGKNNQLSGLTVGELYALSTTGDVVEISTITPVSGQILQVLGTAINSTTLAVNISQPILRE